MKDINDLRTCYELTKHFNIAVGHHDGSFSLGLNHNLSRLMCNLISEEFLELIGAVREGNVKEVIDACGDLQVVINNLLLCLGVDGDDLNREIFLSNMTKVCSTRQEAQVSIGEYAKKGKRSVCRKNPFGQYVICDAVTGKVLKPVTFELPNLERFVC